MTLTPQLILLIGIVAIVVLTGGLGVALALGARLFSRQVTSISAPAGPPTAAVAEAPKAPAAIRRRRTGGATAAIFSLVVIAAGVGAGFFARLMPTEASREAGRVDLLFNSMLGIAASIFLLVECGLLYSAFRFRRRQGDQTDGPPIHGSNRLEIAWSVVPAIIVAWLGVYSYQILSQIRSPQPDAMLVEVRARQFEWQFRYPDSGVLSSDLHAPVGKAVHLKMMSDDVIHSFWVPAFRVKEDVIPLRETDAYSTATETGTFPVVCAELCGAGHAGMGLSSHVIVQAQADFDAWIAQQKAAQPADPRVKLFTETYGCNGCHTLQAAGAAGQIGPDLDGIGTRAATRVPGLSAEDYIRQSILDPNAFIAPQCPTGACPSGVMPQDFKTRMAPADLDALVSLLLEQK